MATRSDTRALARMRLRLSTAAPLIVAAICALGIARADRSPRDELAEELAAREQAPADPGPSEPEPSAPASGGGGLSGDAALLHAPDGVAAPRSPAPSFDDFDPSVACLPAALRGTLALASTGIPESERLAGSLSVRTLGARGPPMLRS